MGLRRDAYVEEIKWKINKWTGEIQEFLSMASQVRANSQAAYQKEIEEIQAKRLDLEATILELQHAGEAEWESMKIGVDTACEVLEKAIHRLLAKIK